MRDCRFICWRKVDDQFARLRPLSRLDFELYFIDVDTNDEFIINFHACRQIKKYLNFF